MHLRLFALFLAAVALAACGGGGTAADEGSAGDTTTQEAVPQESQVVVRYDLDADGNEDHLTLDTRQSPFTIVEALGGVGAGVPVDLTDTLKGGRIDVAVSDALNAYLADALAVASGTTLDVEDSTGRQVSVTVFE